MGEVLNRSRRVPTVPVARSESLDASGVGLIVLAVAAWTAVVGGIAVWRHTQFLSHRADLGSMVQAVWSSTQGRPLEVTDISGEQVARLAGHVDPILVLYTPVWWAYPSPVAMIVAQAAVLAAGVYPVIRLALKHAGSRLAAALLGAWYLAIPWIVWLAFAELNPLTLSLPFLLYAIWFLDEHRLVPAVLFATLALFTGELMGLTVAGLGLWYAIGHRRVRPGLGLVAFGAVWTVACLMLIIPAFSDGRSSRFYSLFESVGGSPVGLLRTAVNDPGAIVAEMTTSGDLQYVAWLAFPAALLFLGRPLLLLVALPQLSVNLLSGFPATVSPLYHYSAPVLAALVAATVMAVGRLPKQLRVVAAGLPLLVAVVLLGSIPPKPGQEAYLFASRETEARTAAMRQAISYVPSDATVTATNRLGAHLSDRRVVQLFPEQYTAEWAVIDSRDPPSNYAGLFGRQAFRRHLHRIHDAPVWERIFVGQGIRVYHRKTLPVIPGLR